MRILFVINKDITLYLFRKELIEELIKENHEIFIACPDGSKLNVFRALGCKIIDIDIDRRGKNPFKEISTIFNITKAIKKSKADYIFTYTIKPNLYVGIISRFKRIKFVPTITGLGTAINENSRISKLLICLFKLGFKKPHTIVFQNRSNLDWFSENINSKVKKILVNGSGVNLDKFQYSELANTGKTTFLYIGRIMKDKGINEFIEAVRTIKSEFKDSVVFQIAGFYEENYEKKIQELESSGAVEYLGFVENTIEIIKNSTVVVLPSYHEGLSNVLLEAQAIGRPVIASNMPGCIETFINGTTGIAIEPKNTSDLINAMRKIYYTPLEEKIIMGSEARKYIEKRFDRKEIIANYIRLIKMEDNV